MAEDKTLERTLRRWHDDPVNFVTENFGIQPDAWQEDALAHIARPDCNRMAMKACKGPGKTACLAWIILWFLATRHDSKIGCTSITEANIDTNLWPELSKWMSRSVFLTSMFTWSTTTVARRSNPANWFAVKRTWPKSGNQQAQADALAGIHADNVMFVLDESGGIPQAVMVTAEAVLATEGSEAKVIQAGNPTHTSGPLHRACSIERHLWHVVTITGDPDNPKRSPRIKIEWAKQQIESYGRDNPWVMVNVLGEFPPSSINSLLGIEDVERAMNRHLIPPLYSHQQKRIGVDVARFGGDRTVLFPRQGMAGFRPEEMRHQDTVQIAAKIAHGIVAWGAELTIVDDTYHWGHGVIDNLTTAGYAVIGVNYAGKALDPRFKNRRAEMWIKGAKFIKERGAALPNIPEMVAELTEPTYTFSGGQFILEDKDQIKERLGRSPDLADAYMTTFAIEELPAQMVEQARHAHHTVSDDYDPFARPGEGGRTTDADWDPFARR